MSGERRQINTSNTKWRAAFLLSFCSSPGRDYTDVKVDFSSWIAARYPSEPRPCIGLYRLVSGRIRPIVGMADVYAKPNSFGFPDDRIVPNTSALRRLYQRGIGGGKHLGSIATYKNTRVS
ncbi:uncharacterized protein UDID_17074 [Ustilago sp. UG-2017a]|nr:uncharacterized protein UDID_17074 [Ustilago sp. UG-2017a]